MSAIGCYVDTSQIILLSDGMVVDEETGKAISLDKCKIALLNHSCAILHVGHLGFLPRDAIKALKKHNVVYPDHVAQNMGKGVRYFWGRRAEVGLTEKPYFFLIIGYNAKGEPEAWEVTNQEAILQDTGGKPHETRKIDLVKNWLFILPGDPEFGEKTDRFVKQGRNIPDALRLAFSEVVGEMADAGVRVGGRIFRETIKPVTELCHP